MTIRIISASIRDGRRSHRVALFFKKYIESNNLAEAEIIDLLEYRFPLFHERLQYQQDPPASVLDFAEKITSADGVIIVTPEYNGGYPASLKNVIDLLYREWKKKPMGIATVSDGAFGGTQVITSLLFSMWKIGAWIIPAQFPCPEVEKNYDEDGNVTGPEAILKRAKLFVGEMLWCIEAKRKMEEQPK